VYLFVPIAVIVAFSFNKPKGKFNIIWQEFTLDNWANPLSNEALTDAMVLSLKIALISAAVATVLGGLVAIALVRYRFKGGALVNLFLVLPLTTPEIVLGASLAALFIDRGVERGFATILIAHIMFCTSFVALTVKARIRGFDWTLEDAAMDLGANPYRVFAKVTLPLIVPGLIAAALLSFALSIDDFIITFFNAGAEETFPLRIYGASRVEISPQINVLATAVLVISVTIMLVGATLSRRR
ncbi:MAG: ABC transporter permease subunit, partial [Candidatus Eremiobacteraeota bacterium]|nr:ABC transporter permease subunit [Candidatus Eremiobacteraeota bacterium]